MQSKNINLGANNIIADENVKGVIMNTIGQMLLMINMIEGMHKDVVAEKQRWNKNIHGVSHRTSMIQGAVEVLTKQRENDHDGKGGGKGWNVLESKAVSNMKMLGADKTGFRMWHEKLVNIMEQLRPGSRGVLKALARHVDNEEDADIHEWIIDAPEYLQMGDAEKAEAQMKSVNEDLYVIMLDKSESEALTRVRACPVGEGLQAYRDVYKWFMGVSGQAISDKIRKLMAPTTPKTEQEIADHLDKWIESIRTLENMRSEYKLQDPFKIIALEQIMAVGQARPSSTSKTSRSTVEVSIRCSSNAENTPQEEELNMGTRRSNMIWMSMD